MRPIFKAGIAGVAAYLLWPDGFFGDSHPPADPSGAPDESYKPFDPEILYVQECVGNAFERYTRDVLVDQPRPINYQEELARLGNGQVLSNDNAGFLEGLKYQLEDPAGRIPLSRLHPYHFALANALFAGGLTRCDEAGSLYKNLLDEIARNKKTADDLTIANSVIGAVAAFVPVVGGAIKLAVGTGLNEGIKGHLQNVKNATEALSALNGIGTGLGVGSPEGQMWFDNEKSPSAPDPKYVYKVDLCTTGLDGGGGFYVGPDGFGVAPNQALTVVRQTRNGTTQLVSQLKEGYRFQPAGGRWRWFAMHRFGWILPWLSYDLGIDQSKERAVAIRAPVYRAADLMSAKMFPMVPPGDKGSSFRYWYRNPVHGDVMGACCPPTSEDVRLTIGGRTYGFDGKDVTGFQNQAVSSFAYANVAQTKANEVATRTTIPGSTGPTPQAQAEDYGQYAAQQRQTNTISTFKGFK